MPGRSVARIAKSVRAAPPAELHLDYNPFTETSEKIGARPVFLPVFRRDWPGDGASDMATGAAPGVLRHLRGVLQQVRRTALLQDGSGLTDQQLLESFLGRRDEAAFESLVCRHGPMVLGVCRRVLRNQEDTEDAFQATFLVLVRKAASLRDRALLGNWLYGVAYRTALDARATRMKRQKREKQVNVMPEPAIDGRENTSGELASLFDQELHRLPEKYRVPVVLCCLQGRTRRSVAGQLGIAVGTLSGRLTTARRRLANRLARRGLTLSVAGFSAVLAADSASACVSPSLVTATVALATAAGGKAAAGVISGRVATLAEGVLRAMLMKKVKIAAAVLLLASLVVGAGLLRPSAAHDSGGAPPRVLRLADRGRRVVWSPDGKALLVVTKVEKTILGIQYNRQGSAIELWDVENGTARQTLAKSNTGGLSYQSVAYSADGKTIAATVTELVQTPNLMMVQDSVKLWDAQSLTLKQTLVGNGWQLVSVALSPDGKLVVGDDPKNKVVHVWDAVTGQVVRTLSTGTAQPWRVAFSPDGKALAVGGQKADGSGDVTLWDPATGMLQRTLTTAKFVTAIALSPDGHLVAASTGGGSIQVWNAGTGKLVASFQASTLGSRSIVFFHAGTILAEVGADGNIRLWDAQTGKLKQTLKGHTDEVHSVAVSPDGKTLASVSQDETLRLWPIQEDVSPK